MKRTLHTLPLLAFLALLLTLTPASLWAATGARGHEQAPAEDDWARIKQAGKIVFGTAADHPPFEFYNTNFALDGFDIALAKALGAELGVEVEFNDYAFDGLLNTVRLGAVDAAIAGISVTPGRQQLVDFTNLYYIGQTSAIAGESFTATIRAATDLAGATVGVQRGTTFQAWAQDNLVDKGVIEQENLLTYGSPSAIVRDLRNGTLDIGLMGQLTAASALRQNKDLRLVGEKFHQQEFAIALPKGSNLTEQLNNALLTLQSNGVFAQLVEEYLQVQPKSVIPVAEAAVVENVVLTATTALTATVVPCITSMAYIADLNLDDKNMTAPPVMAPGQNFTKGWRVQNTGNCAWDPTFTLAYANGNRIESSMGGSPVPVGRAVEPGEMVDLSANLRAPQTYGVFQGFWQLRDTLGQAFGETVWVGIQVPDPNPPAPPPPPPADINPNLRADTNYVNPGQCTTIRWDVDNVAAVYFVDGGNTQGVGGHDTRHVCPSATTTYVLRVTRMDGGNVDFPITINVGGGSNADYSINFWADSNSIDGGQCTALRWDVRNVQAVYLNGEGVPGVSARDVCPGNTETYTLNVTKYDGGQDSRQVTVEVRNPAPEPAQPPVIERFSVSENEIFRGKCVHFEWRTDNADGINLSRNGSTIVGGGPGNGSADDCPEAVGLHEYRLDAYGNGSTAQTVTVNVVGPQPR